VNNQIYIDRLNAFQALAGPVADLTFLPVSSDMQYLAGVPRTTPNFGAVRHPGMWLEGGWLAPGHSPVLALPRMTAVFGGLPDLPHVERRILGDWDDPVAFVRDLLRGFGLPASPRIAVSDQTSAETVLALQAVLPQARFVSASALLSSLRMIKSEDEIALMRRAGEITEAAFSAVLGQLRHGMTELDVVAEVHFQLWRLGSPGSSFTPLLENSGPHHPLFLGQPLDAWRRELHPPVSVLFDFGAIYEGYCYDFGRTVFFGEPEAEAVRVHRLVMEAQAAGVAALRANAVTGAEADAAARAVIEDAGYGKYFMHRLGHSIGLDVHEPPFLTSGDDTVVREGMLFTVEPSIMIADRYSARVEDIVLVRASGGEPLTSGFQTLHVVD
jgi:Xaa-Pro aminopeptidase